MNANIKIRLQDKIDKQLSARNKELVQLNLLLQSTNSPYEKGMFNRLIIPHIYSHFEGFIKNASVLFLEYIINIYNPENDLPDNIFAVASRETIKKYANYNSNIKHMELINILRRKPEMLEFNPSVVIDTHSNLNSKCLKEIMFICGIQYDGYWQEKSFFIDNMLLKNRNLISHGEMVPIEDATAIECLSKVMNIIQTYKQKLEEKM